MFYYRGSSPFQMTGDSANDIRIDNVFLERLMDLMSFINNIATPLLAVMGFDYRAFSSLSRPEGEDQSSG